jgi:hypothetical protein
MLDLNDAIGGYRLLTGIIGRMDRLPSFSFIG